MWCITEYTCFTREASPSRVTTCYVLLTPFNELNVVKCVAIQLALLGNITTQMPLGKNSVCPGTQTLWDVYSLRCRKCFRGLPNIRLLWLVDRLQRAETPISLLEAYPNRAQVTKRALEKSPQMFEIWRATRAAKQVERLSHKVGSYSVCIDLELVLSWNWQENFPYLKAIFN
jgi:hypothetical protein